MTETRTLKIDDLSGRVDVYEGETVRFTVDATSFYKDDTLSSETELTQYKPGDKFEMINAFSEASKYDIESSSNAFKYVNIDENGQASWEYTFLDDGFSEGPEVLDVNGYIRQRMNSVTAYIPRAF